MILARDRLSNVFWERKKRLIWERNILRGQQLGDYRFVAYDVVYRILIDVQKYQPTTK